MDLQHSTLGKYKLEEQLGAGGMGAVFRSTHPQLNRPVAIKVILRTFSDNAEVRQRFIREAQVVSQLSHPGIVRLFDIDETDGMLYLVMELVEGPSLADALQQETLPLERILTIGIELAEALHYAHEEGMMHRDLKPANVLIRPNGRTVLVDFGLARLVDGTGDNQLTSTGTVMGTVAYMSPEQLQAQHIDRRTDIYALGIMLYKMLTGRLPFEGDTAQMMFGHIYSAPTPLSVANHTIPFAVEQLVMTMIAKERSQRPATAADVANHLRSIKASLTNPQHHPGAVISAPAAWNQPQAAQYQPVMPTPPLVGNPPSQPFGSQPTQPGWNNSAGPPSQPFGNQSAQPNWNNSAGPPSQPFGNQPTQPNWNTPGPRPVNYAPNNQPYPGYAPGTPGKAGLPVALLVTIGVVLLLGFGSYYAYTLVSKADSGPGNTALNPPTKPTSGSNMVDATAKPAPTEETDQATPEQEATPTAEADTPAEDMQLSDKDGVPVTARLPDGESYTISGLNTRPMPDGTTNWFYGAIQNDTDQARAGVRVTLNLLDAEGKVLDYAEGGVRPLVMQPGDKTGFEVIFSRKLPTYASYRLDVKSSPAAFMPFEFVRGLEVSNDTLVDDFFPFVEGTIKNSTDKRVESINVYVTAYDETDHVVGLSLGTDLDSDLLIPGAESSFKADILINGLDVATTHYEYIVEGQVAP